MSSTRLRKRAHGIDDELTGKRRRVRLETNHQSVSKIPFDSSEPKRGDLYDTPGSPGPLDTASQQAFSRLRPLANFSAERDELHKQLESAQQELEASQQQLSIAQDEASRARRQVELLHRQLGQSQSQLMVAQEDLLRYSQSSPQSVNNLPIAPHSTQPADSLRFAQRPGQHQGEDRAYLPQLADTASQTILGRPRKQSLAPPSKPRGRPRKQSQTPASKPRGRPRKSLVTGAGTSAHVATTSPLVITPISTQSSPLLTKRPTRYSKSERAQSTSKSEQSCDKKSDRVLSQSVVENHNTLLNANSGLGSSDLNSNDQEQGDSDDPSQDEEEDEKQPAARAQALLNIGSETGMVADEDKDTAVDRIKSPIPYDVNNFVDEDSGEEDVKPIIRGHDPLDAAQETDEDPVRPIIPAYSFADPARETNGYGGKEEGTKNDIPRERSEDTDDDEAKPIVLLDPSPDLVGESETGSVPSSPPGFTIPTSAQPKSSHILTASSKGDVLSNHKTLSSRRRIRRTTVPLPTSSRPRSRALSTHATREPGASFTDFQPLKEQVAKVTKEPKRSSAAKVFELSSTPGPKIPKVVIQKSTKPMTQTKAFDPRTKDLMKLAKGKGKGRSESATQSANEDDESGGSSSSSSSDSSSDSDSESDRD